MQQINVSLTSAAAAIGAPLPSSGTYLQIHNPSATASLAYTFDGSTPVINGNGITLGPLVTATYDNPAGGRWTGPLTMIGAANQSATLLYATGQI